MIRAIVYEDEQEHSCSRFLTQEKNLDLIHINSENKILDTYSKVLPNVLILNINMFSKNYADIVQTILLLPNNFNLHSILILCSINETFCVSHSSKTIHFIRKPISKDILINSINSYDIQTNDNNSNFLNDKLHQDVFKLQTNMKLPNYTNGSIYLRKAVRDCFREPRNLNNLDNVYKRIAAIHGIEDYRKISWDIRNTLNVYREHYSSNESTLKELFGNDFCIEDITPRHVISAMVVYLRIHF